MTLRTAGSDIASDYTRACKLVAIQNVEALLEDILLPVSIFRTSNVVDKLIDSNQR